MVETLRSFTESLPAVLQWLGIVAAGAIPFVESYLGAALGVLAGLNPVVAIVAAVVGNVASMLALVLGAGGIRRRVVGQREDSPRRARLRRAFDRYGVAGVSLLGQSILPSQVTATAMVSFGASRSAVIRWQIISIILWGTAFGVLTAVGVDLVAR